MGGYHETRLRQALLTVRDTDVLCEMAAGWRASIGNLNAADDTIRRGIRALRDSSQLGDATRGAAMEALREMSDHIAEQRLRLGLTARALEAAGGALSQAAATIRRWDQVGDPVPPGPAPAADPTVADQSSYLAAVTVHGQQSAAYHEAAAHREDEARQVMEGMERVFSRCEDTIREQHDIPREEHGTDPPPVWPPTGWPGPQPEPVGPEWPPLPPWPPSHHTEPTDPEPAPGPRSGPGSSHAPGNSPAEGTTTSTPGSLRAASDPSPQSTSVTGSSQSGVAYQASASLTSAGSLGGAATGSVPAAGALAGMAGTAGTAGSVGLAGARGVAGGAAGAGAAPGRPGGAGTGRTGVSGGRGGRRSDASRGRPDVFTSGDTWLDDEDTSPDVLR